MLPAGEQAHARAGDVLLHQRLHLEARRHRSGRDRAGAELQRRASAARSSRVRRWCTREWLAKRVDEHDADVWLLNTGWTGGPYGVGERFKLSWTRTFVNRILDGSLSDVDTVQHPVFGLHMPVAVEGVPDEVLDPRNTWADGAAYDEKAADLARRFRENDAKYTLSDAVRGAGPTTG